MRIGLACPYSWDVPGGVQVHVRDLAETLIAAGHDVSVITPAEDESALPPYAVHAGRAVGVPYNGSVARLLLGPLSASRVRRWLREGEFDVLHIHEIAAPSVSLLAAMLGDGPMVATFHTSNPRSKILNVTKGALQTVLEKVRARIAVSEAARRTIVEHLGVDAVVIPNGVAVDTFASASPLPGREPDGCTVGFLGRLDEPRKGLGVLLGAFPALVERVPSARLLVAGPGDVDEARADLPRALARRADFVGRLSDADLPRFYRSADVYCAPNTGQESFGIVLLEAMAAGTPVVASDIDAFRRVLDDGRSGRLFARWDSAALADALAGLLGDPSQRAVLAAAGQVTAAAYDWRTVAARVVGVYEMVAGGAPVSLAANPPTL